MVDFHYIRTIIVCFSLFVNYFSLFLQNFPTIIVCLFDFSHNLLYTFFYQKEFNMEEDKNSIPVNVKDNICSYIDHWLTNNKNYNSASFARELGLSDSSVKRWRKKICAPDLSLLPRICKIMNVSLLTLFGLEFQDGLTPTEQSIIKNYQTNPDFKLLVDNYFNNEKFKTIIDSIIKLSK